MSILDPTWKYHSAEVSKKPGYLSRRFAEIRKRQKETKAEVEQKVQPIRKVK